jgi:glycosyltransferase involved in cell wall biosynthesis
MGGELAEVYASADVFVFPSRADTFGNVILEALASGTPVAAYPVTGPVDILGDGKGGALDEDLREAALRALDVPRNEAVAKASGYDWNECARQFLSHLPKTAMAARAHGFMPRPFPGASPR